MKKILFSITELEGMGYSHKLLSKALHSQDFSTMGYRLACSRNSKTFFFKDKLDKWIEQRMDERGGVL